MSFYRKINCKSKSLAIAHLFVAMPNGIKCTEPQIHEEQACKTHMGPAKKNLSAIVLCDISEVSSTEHPSDLLEK